MPSRLVALKLDVVFHRRKPAVRTQGSVHAEPSVGVLNLYAQLQQLWWKRRPKLAWPRGAQRVQINGVHLRVIEAPPIELASIVGHQPTVRRRVVAERLLELDLEAYFV